MKRRRKLSGDKGILSAYDISDDMEGLLFIPHTLEDEDICLDVFEESPYYFEHIAMEHYFYFHEEYSAIDNLERELDEFLFLYDVGGYFERV